MRMLLLALLLLVGRAQAAITYGSDYVSTAQSQLDSLTQTATLGSTGANSILFVVITSEYDFDTPSVNYNGVAMTQLLPRSTFSGSATYYRQTFYINANLTSGQNITVFSGSPRKLNGSTSDKAWHIRYFTYGGVNGIGTKDVTALWFTTSTSGSAVNTALSFPALSASTSSVVRLLVVQSGGRCANTYTTDFGTVRSGLTANAGAPPQYETIGAWSEAIAIADYAPGSTSSVTINQGWNPQFCTASGYGWGIELLDAGGGPTPTPTATPTPVIHQSGLFEINGVQPVGWCWPANNWYPVTPVLEP